ncbi:MAG TPA: GAF domain-containing protein, partial [Anaerolineales bacterium]
MALPQGQLAWDILLSELDFPGLQWKLQNGGIRCPVVIVADPALEHMAVELMEAGKIADYVLTSRSQMKRIPWVLKAALARGRIRGDWRADGSRGVLQEAIYQIAEASEKAESLDALLPLIHEIIGRVMPAGNFYIALYDAESDTLNFPYFVDEQDVLLETSIKARNGLTKYVLRSGKSFLCSRDSQERLAVLEQVETIGSPSEIWLGVPLIIDATPMGVMVVQHYSDRNAYGETE